MWLYGEYKRFSHVECRVTLLRLSCITCKKWSFQHAQSLLITETKKALKYLCTSTVREVLSQAVRGLLCIQLVPQNLKKIRGGGVQWIFCAPVVEDIAGHEFPVNVCAACRVTLDEAMASTR